MKTTDILDEKEISTRDRTLTRIDPPPNIQLVASQMARRQHDMSHHRLPSIQLLLTTMLPLQASNLDNSTIELRIMSRPRTEHSPGTTRVTSISVRHPMKRNTTRSLRRRQLNQQLGRWIVATTHSPMRNRDTSSRQRRPDHLTLTTTQRTGTDARQRSQLAPDGIAIIESALLYHKRERRKQCLHKLAMSQKPISVEHFRDSR